jgi:hypothetical protein
LQLWQKLFCESDVTYLVKIDNKHEIHNFNDSIDGCLYGSSPLDSNNDRQHLSSATNLDTIDASGFKLTPDTAASSSASSYQIHNLLKNAIDTNVILKSAGNPLNKSRSFDDLCKASATLSGSFIAPQQSLSDTKQSTDLNGINVDVANTSNHNGDPIQVARSSSESNLLLDALKSTSPKSQNGATFHYSSKLDALVSSTTEESELKNEPNENATSETTVEQNNLQNGNYCIFIVILLIAEL